jgi:F-type H+-transporting ATPase subunit gamma
MPSLRDYRDRIKSVKSTRKITAAMKMVAASKLRRAQEQAEAARPYAVSMMNVMKRVAANMDAGTVSGLPLLMMGTGSDQRHLLVVVTADRGLCGGFNANIIKEARKAAYALKNAGKDVSIVCVGRKGFDAFQSDFKTLIRKSFIDVTSKKRIEYVDAQNVRDYIVGQFDLEQFDVCTLIYSSFKSILVQKPTQMQLIPFNMDDFLGGHSAADAEVSAATGLTSSYVFEPSESDILDALLPRNIGVQIYSALLDSAAGEQASRMTAMDNATRNAGEVIDSVTLKYNRARQAHITKELIEIISGAEAL